MKISCSSPHSRIFRKLDLFSESITDAGVVHLKRLTDLRELEINFTQITDKGLIQLKSLTKLRTLSLKNMPTITDTGLAYLDSFQELEELSIDNYYSSPVWMKQPITDAGLAHLRKLPKLRDRIVIPPAHGQGTGPCRGDPPAAKTILNCSKITDEGLSQLEHCSELQALDLWRTKITDAGPSI